MREKIVALALAVGLLAGTGAVAVSAPAAHASVDKVFYHG